MENRRHAVDRILWFRRYLNLTQISSLRAIRSCRKNFGRSKQLRRAAIRILRLVQKRFGKGRWRNLTGIANVRLSVGTIWLAELHWFEAHGIGKKQLRIKRFLDLERWKNNRNQLWNSRSVSGVMIPHSLLFVRSINCYQMRAQLSQTAFE